VTNVASKKKREKKKVKKTCCEKPLRKMCKRCPRRCSSPALQR